MNKLCPHLLTGTMGELLVQMRLLQFEVQAAPPLKDTGNDLVAIRGNAFRAIQVKTTDGDSYVPPRKKRRYHILAAVRLIGESRDVKMDQSEIYLIEETELSRTSRRFEEIQHLRLSSERIDQLFPPEERATDETDLADMDRSHVLNIPKAFPFEREDLRWTTFLGRVVMPLMKERQALFWFSYYGDCARLRIRTSEQEHRDIQSELDQLMKQYQLTYRKNDKGEIEESHYRLENGLGDGRFLSPERRDLSGLGRALLVLELLHAGAQLFLNTLVPEGEYWREELNDDGNSAYRSSSRSYLHLLHNLTGSDIPVYVCKNVDGKDAVLSDYYYSHAVKNKRVENREWPCFRVKV